MPINGMYVIAVIIILFFCFFLFYSRLENSFVFYPEKRFYMVPEDWRLEYEDIVFEAEDRTRLHGWLFPLEGNGPVILFFHGNAGNISHRLENVSFLLRQGLQVFIIDYRGYGKSDGKPSEMGIYMDGLAAYDFLVKQKHISPGRIVLFGRSLGAAAAVETALRREVKSLIIESAFTSTRGMARAIPLFWPFSFFIPIHYNNLEKIARVMVPKLIIHGEADGIVPISMGRKIHEVAQEPKFFMPLKGAGHNDTYIVGGKQYFRAFTEFAWKSKLVFEPN